MGNRTNRVRMRKKKFNHINNILRVRNKKNVPSNLPEMVSILNPIDSSVPTEHNQIVDPLQSRGEYRVQEKLLVFKTNSLPSDDQSNEFDNVASTTPMVTIKSEQHENVMILKEENRVQDVQDEQDPLFVVKTESQYPTVATDEQSNEFENIALTAVHRIDDKERLLRSVDNKCRLCLTKEESDWIEIFSREPCSYANVNEITPANIVEIIEQCTSIKISKDDRLPHKLCLKCLQGLQFIFQFKQKSLESQNVLISEINGFDSISNEQNYPPKNVLLNGDSLGHRVIVLKRIPNPKKQFTLSADTGVNESSQIQCEMCGEVFEKSKLFQDHMNKHRNFRPFACTEPFCDKRFFTCHNRRAHIRSVHESRKYKCDICEKPFISAHKLNCHRTNHFPPTIPCDICGKLLRNQGAATKHRAVHIRVERNHKCDECGKAFKNAYTLRVHRRLHTNEKPFVCSKCGEAFTVKCLLQAHEDKMHSGEK